MSKLSQGYFCFRIIIYYLQFPMALSVITLRIKEVTYILTHIINDANDVL